VYLASDTKLERQVALKILPTACGDDQERSARFFGEARAASALNHPNIITIYEIGESDGIHFIATEYIEGELLEAKMDQRRLSISEVVGIAVQTAAAIAVAHDAGIVHRDIKPANIMVRTDGLVKVLDFGIAKLTRPEEAEVGAEDETRLLAKTKPGYIIGTVGYMSPEQARGRQLDGRSDIWSLGCVLYEMLSGSKAFAGDTVADIFAGIIHRDPAPLANIRNDVPEDLERIVLKMLGKEVENRYQSSRELFDDLKRLETRLLVEGELTKERPISVSAESRAANRRETIVVLPFADISTDGDNRYFSDGLTEEIIINLSKLHMLSVVARRTAMQYVNEGKSHQEIAGQFNVRYLLEGSVRRHGNDLRITAQLVDAINQVYLWADTYRGTIDDVFEIQEKVAGQIVDALSVRLSPDEREVLRKRYTDNTEAYQLYLQGRFFWNKRSEEALKTAIRYFEMAIEQDPNYALAWAGIADSYSLVAEYGNVPRKQLFPLAYAAVDKALEIDDKLAEAHTSRAVLLMLHDWQWEESRKAFERAIELDPNYATAHHWYASWFLSMDRMEEAISTAQKAAALDPVSQAIQKDLGLAYYYDRQYEKAEAVAKRTLELDPGYAAAHRLLSLAYLGQGRFAEAIEENEKWGSLAGSKGDVEVALAQLLAASGDHGAARELIESLQSRVTDSDNACRGFALAYAALEELDEAFLWLEKGYERREESMLSIKVDPKADNLKNDPRFAELLNKIGLSD